MKTWVTLLAAVLALPAQAAELPDFGSPADAAISKSREAQIGRGVMLQLRNAGVVIDDPFLTEYVSNLGSQLATHINNGDFDFNFFVVKDDSINAFALPGGYIGVNSGLILASDTESELAGVLAHEISHVTQRHIARAAYDNQRNSIVSMAAMLAALVLGAATDMSSDAMQGVMMGSQALAAQRQINFTRSNEHEADRVGIELLSGAGFDPNGMSAFFEKLGRRYGGSSQYVPAILQTHPVTSERVAEARDRARQLPAREHTSSLTYSLTKARVIALNAATPDAAFAAFRDKAESDAPEDRYGLALASMRMSLHDSAESLFRDLVADFPNTMAFRVGQAEAMAASGATGAGACALCRSDPPVSPQHPVDDQLRRDAHRRRQAGRSARAAARSVEQRARHGAAASPDRACRECRRRRREFLFLHVVLLHRDRQPAARHRPSSHGPRDARTATTSIGRVSGRASTSSSNTCPTSNASSPRPTANKSADFTAASCSGLK